MDAFDAARATASHGDAAPPPKRAPERQAGSATSKWQQLLGGAGPSGGAGRTAVQPFSRKRKVTTLASATTAASKPAAKAQQLYLDFGQRSFGRTHECAECGLLYTKGEPTDEEAHRRHHRRALQGVRVRGVAANRVACELADGSRVVCIRSTDGAEALRKLGEAKELVDSELGSTPGLPADYRAFLYLDAATQQMVGCAISEPLNAAFRAVPPAEAPPVGDAAGSSEAAPDDEASRRHAEGGVLRHDGVSTPAMCGISHIWTDARRRRSGVATALLDAVRWGAHADPRPPPSRAAARPPSLPSRPTALFQEALCCGF